MTCFCPLPNECFPPVWQARQGKSTAQKPSTQTAPSSLVSFPTSHLSQWHTCICKQCARTALNGVLPQKTGNDLSLLYPFLHEGPLCCTLDLITSLRAANPQWGFGQGFRAWGKQHHPQNVPSDAWRTATGTQTKGDAREFLFPSIVSSVLQEAVPTLTRAALSTKLKDSKICLWGCQGQRRGWKHMFSVFGMIQFR